MGRKGKKVSRKLRMQRRLKHRLTLTRTPVITAKPRGMRPNVFSLISKITQNSSATGRNLARGRYTHLHRILLVGEGNFSFAVCLASALGGDKIVATSFDSRSDLFDKYPEAREHVGALKGMGVHVLHGIDATRLDAQRGKLFTSPHIAGNFDRVVFNFPHVGGGSVKEDLVANQHLLTKFFACAGHLLSDKGEIHVTLRSTSFYESWGIQTLAEKTGLSSLEAVDFDQNAFHGYQQVRTRGSTCMREAPTTSGAKTYRFIFPAAKLEKQKTDTTASIAPHKKTVEITSPSTTRSRDDKLCEPGDHDQDGRNRGSCSSEDSDESSSSERGSFTAESNVVAKERKLSFEFKTERAHAHTNTDAHINRDTDTDTDTEVPSASTQITMTYAKLAAAEKRKRQLLLELRSEREHFPDAESTQSKRARTSSLDKNRSRRISQSNASEKQIREPEEDTLAAMLSQWKQSTTYT